MGVYERISGILFGRARDYSADEKKQLEDTILEVVKGEFGNSTLPIVCNLDFGHTDPQLIMPLGNKWRIDSNRKEIMQIESAFAEEM